MLPKQPLQVENFSGGITDKVLQQDPRRSAVLDNYLITSDSRLEVRPGIIAIDPTYYHIPAAGTSRVNFLQWVNGENNLLGISGNKASFFDKISGWTSPTTPSGNSPVQGGNSNSQVTIAEFQKQIYITNDGTSATDGTLPSKIFQNESNAWVARTAGLPRAYTTNPYTNSTILNACITLANALRTSFIAHMGDAYQSTYSVQFAQDPSTFTQLHLNIDKYSLSYLVTQSFTGYPETPSPVPTPAPAASDQTTLFALVKALGLAFNHHIQDSTVGSSIQSGVVTNPFASPYYHSYIHNQLSAFGPAAEISDTSTTTDLVQAAAQLDDLRQKWYWHQFGINVHSYSNDIGMMSRYLVTASKIGQLQYKTNDDGSLELVIDAAPTVTPDYTDIFNYVNNLKNSYLQHVTDPLGVVHSQRTNSYKGVNAAGAINTIIYDPIQNINLPNCTDLDSAFLLIYWLRGKYFEHYLDSQCQVVGANSRATNTAATASGSNYLSMAINMTSSTASNNVAGAGTTGLTSVTRVSDGTSVQLIPGTWISGISSGTFNSKANSSNTSGGMVISSGSGTAVLDRTAALSVTLTAVAMGSKYHVYTRQPLVVPIGVDSTVAVGSASSILASAWTATGSTTQGWMDLALEFFNCMASHIIDPTVHISASSFPVTAITGTTFYIPEIEQVSYAFYYSDDYTVQSNGLEYLVRGNPVYTPVVDIVKSYPYGVTIPSQNTTYYASTVSLAARANVISSIPVLANDAITNYNTTNVKMNIYRTVDDGIVYYKLDQVANGTTTYSDTVNDTIAASGDTALIDRAPIYTTGGVVGSDQPPVSKFIHNLNGTVYYGGISDSGQFFPNRLRQSLALAPEWAPASFFDDFDQDIVGISSSRSSLIVFCTHAVYRENGAFNSLGQGSMTHEKISDTMGGINAKSIVQTEIGAFFAGTDGFYYTDGYQVIKLSLEIDDTYANLIRSSAQGRSIYGSYDRINRRIFWACKETENQAENSIIFVYYLNFGVKPSASFTRVLNRNFLEPASLAFKDDVLYIGSTRGNVFKTDKNTKTDPLILEDGAPIATWKTQYLPYEYTSCAIDCGTIFNRKYITKLHVVGDNSGNAAVQPYVIRDKNADLNGIRKMAQINYIDNITWGTPTCVWGVASWIWNNLGKFDVWRRFPKTSLRSDFVQVSFRPAETVVYASSVGFPFGATASANAGTGVITIATPAGYLAIVWPKDVYGYSISFDVDNYTTQYPITTVGGAATITVTDSSSTLSTVPSGSLWQIRGIKKEQRPTITSYVLHFANLGDKTQAFGGPYSTGQAGNAGGNPP